MRPSRILACAAVVASAALLAACAGRDIAAPDLATPDGAHLLVPNDGPTRALTPGTEPEIRIGVVQSASSITLGSAADYVVRDKGTGLAIFPGHAGSVGVALLSVGEARYHLQVMCAGNLATVQERKDAAEAEGYPTLAEYYAAGSCTRLYIGDFAISGTFGVRTAFKNELIARGLAPSDAFWRSITPVGGTVYAVTSGATTKQVNNPVTITSSDGIVTINGRPYRGLGEARVNSTATLAGINQLPLEQYLYGVVPRELGPIAYPEMEAQKAQAIVARTYAIVGLGKRSSDGYDLTATTSDQVYGGYDEYALSNQAVDETRGMVVTQDGRLISTLYFSTSGGHTADNEEAFNSAAVPYLRGVPDAERGNAFERVPSLAVFKSYANPASLRATKEGDFESDWSRYHRWTFEWTADEISSVVSAFAGQPVGKVLEINALERGPSGRVLKLEYVTEAGNFYAYRDAIRASLRYINATGTPTNLLSTLFFIEPVTNRKTKEVTGFIAYGGGFGHGVGMSQTGAAGMAQKGHTVDEILQHYYQGIELASQY